MIDPLRITAAGEGATGVVLILFPQLVVELLFGATEAGAGLAMSRITGMALLALGIACWPDTGSGGGQGRGRTALLVYGALATIYLAIVGLEGELRGPVLWPAVVVHLVVTVLLAKAPGTPPRAAKMNMGVRQGATTSDGVKGDNV